MLEIAIIWFACSQLREKARERDLGGVPYGVAFVAFYLVALVIGSVLGSVVWRIHPIAGAYAIALPGALVWYQVLAAIIRRQPLGDNAPSRRPPLIPTGLPITIPCVHCAQPISAYSGQRGRVVPCTHCGKASKVPASLPSDHQEIPSINSPSLPD